MSRDTIMKKEQQKPATLSFEDVKKSFTAERQDGDADLVADVRTAMLSSGLLQLVVANYDNHPDILDAKTKRPEQQRFLLNRYFTLQLMTEPSKSIEQRFCLIPNGNLSDWLRLFNQKVLPFLVEHNLPTKV